MELFSCPYSLKVQARPPRDQKLASQSKVSGQGEKDGERDNLEFSKRGMGQLILWWIPKGSGIILK